MGRMRCATNTGYDQNIDEAVCHGLSFSWSVGIQRWMAEHKPTTTGGPNWKFKSSSYRDHYWHRRWHDSGLCFELVNHSKPSFWWICKKNINWSTYYSAIFSYIQLYSATLYSLPIIPFFQCSTHDTSPQFPTYLWIWPFYHLFPSILIEKSHPKPSPGGNPLSAPHPSSPRVCTSGAVPCHALIPRRDTFFPLKEKGVLMVF